MASFDVQVVLRLIDQLTKPAKDAASALKDIGKTGGTKKLGEDITKAADGAKKLADDLKDVTRSARDVSRATGPGLARNIKKAAGESRDFARELKRVEAAAEGVGRALRRQLDTMVGMGRLYGRAAIGGARLARRAVYGAGLGGLISLGGGVALARNYADDIDRQQERAAAIGMRLQTYRELGYAATLGGSSPEAMDEATQTLLKNIGGAKSRKPTGPLARYLGRNNKRLLNSLKKLDLTAEDGSAKALEMALAALAAEPDEGKRRAAAQAFFGGQADDMLMMARDGPEATKARREEARTLMGSVDDDAAKAAARFNDELDRLKTSLIGLRDEIGQTIIPAVTDLVEAIRTTIVERREEIAGAVRSVVDGIVAAVKEVDWSEIRAAVTSIADGVLALKDWVGGWANMAKLVAGIALAPWMAALATSVISLAGALWILGRAVASAVRAGKAIAGVGAAAAGATGAGAAGAGTAAAGAAAAKTGGRVGRFARWGGRALGIIGLGLTAYDSARYLIEGTAAAADRQAETNARVDAINAAIAERHRLTTPARAYEGKDFTLGAFGGFRSPDRAADAGGLTKLGPVGERRMNATLEQLPSAMDGSGLGSQIEDAAGNADLSEVGRKLMEDFAASIAAGAPAAVAAAQSVASQIRSALTIQPPRIPAPVAAAPKQQARAIDRSLAGALHDGVT